MTTFHIEMTSLCSPVQTYLGTATMAFIVLGALLYAASVVLQRQKRSRGGALDLLREAGASMLAAGLLIAITGPIFYSISSDAIESMALSLMLFTGAAASLRIMWISGAWKPTDALVFACYGFALAALALLALVALFAIPYYNSPLGCR
jgi:hypothetical protein